MNQTGEQINRLLQERGLSALNEEIIGKLVDYISLFLRWNQRINLSAVRDEEGIISTHIIESIEVARLIPANVLSLLDFGSGGGLPGVPIAICRPEIAVTLAESQNKKAAFLSEVVRTVGIHATVHAQRAETLQKRFDCVTLRAVDKMPQAVASAAPLVAHDGWLALLTTEEDLAELKLAAGPEFRWSESIRLSGSRSRLLALGQRISS